MSKKKQEWKLVGKVTRNDMRGKDPVSKLHKKLKAMAPDGEEIAQYGMSKEAVEYFRKQLEAIAKKQGYNKKHSDSAVAMAMLQYAPCEIEGLTGFQVYYREK
jgi:hypothetical protein